jgi:hypothetical protein
MSFLFLNIENDAKKGARSLKTFVNSFYNLRVSSLHLLTKIQETLSLNASLKNGSELISCRS